MPKTYRLSLESGPKHMKTMVHVLELLGCVATGPTTEAALASAPDAIRSYLRFLRQIGEDQPAPSTAFETAVSEHVTEGQWLGNGDPSITFEGELEPVSEAELETWTARFLALRHALADWAASLASPALDAPTGDPTSKRPARAVLVHVLPSSQYLSTILGPTPGYAKIVRLAERGEMPIDEALRASGDLLADHILTTATEEHRTAVVKRANDVQTLRKRMRRLLEHDWEHLAELARRDGGPRIEDIRRVEL